MSIFAPKLRVNTPDAIFFTPILVDDEDSMESYMELQVMQKGSVRSIVSIAISNNIPAHIPNGKITNIFSMLGIKFSGEKALIALNLDIDEIKSTRLITIYAVDQSGASGGGAGATHTYQVAGTVKIDTVLAARTVRVFDLTTGSVVVETVSDSDTGEFTAQWTADTANDVLVVATDNYGKKWTADTYYSAGDIVHPTNASGYVYTADNAGTSGSSEPGWNISSVTTDGEITWSVSEFFRPVASGPITPEQIA